MELQSPLFERCTVHSALISDTRYGVRIERLRFTLISYGYMMSPLLCSAVMNVRVVPIIAALLLSFAGTAVAQPGEDVGTLYFPPTLTVNYQFGQAAPVLGITESITPTSTTLLPILFFDHPGDWAIPTRYQVFSGSFKTDDYADTNSVGDWNPMGKYYELLNIVGYRMREHPRTVIHLLGGYSTEPGENAEIATARGEVVREYLMNVWHIPPERIGLLPSRRMCDSSDHFLRQQEARQVMIVSNDWDILKPVDYSIAIRSVGSLYMRFAIDPRVDPQDVEEITIVMAADDKIIGQNTVKGYPDSTTYQLRGMWWCTDPTAHQKLDFTSIAIEAHVRLRDGRIRHSNTEKIGVRVNRYQSDYSNEIPQTLTLPFFTYKDSTLNGYHRLLIEQFMKTQPAGQPIAIDFMGRADLSEDPEVDPALLADYSTNQGDYDPYSYSYSPPNMGAGTDQLGMLHLWSEVSQEITFAPEPVYTNTAPLQADTAMSEEGWEDSAGMDIEENRFTSDSLAMARTRSVERYLRDSLKLTISTFDELPDRERAVSTTFEYLPEERWQARSVMLVIYPHQYFTQQQEWIMEAMKERQEAEEEEE